MIEPDQAAIEAASAAIDRYCENTKPRPGQVYRSCDPRGGPLVRVVDVHPNSATVVDAQTGKRRRRILAKFLHDSPTTKAGKPRRTGYALETK